MSSRGVPLAFHAGPPGRHRLEERERYAPSPQVARFVDRYRQASWDLTRHEPYHQRVFSHPVVNVVFTPERATINGVATRVTSRRLAGTGWALGIMFRPAGFRPLLGRSMATIRDRTLGVTSVFGPEAGWLTAMIAGTAAPTDETRAVVDRFLARRLPAPPQPGEATSALVEHIAAEPALVRVEALASAEGVSVRQLQRRFADHVGVSPKAVIRRYRLYEAAERVRHGAAVEWAALAAELGYSDQAHLTRDFAAAIGLPPEQYRRMCTVSDRDRAFTGSRVLTRRNRACWRNVGSVCVPAATSVPPPRSPWCCSRRALASGTAPDPRPARPSRPWPARPGLRRRRRQCRRHRHRSCGPRRTSRVRL